MDSTLLPHYPAPGSAPCRLRVMGQLAVILLLVAPAFLQESVGKKSSVFSVLPWWSLFLAISTRRHEDHGVYTERSDFSDRLQQAGDHDAYPFQTVRAKSLRHLRHRTESAVLMRLRKSPYDVAPPQVTFTSVPARLSLKSPALLSTVGA